MYSNPMGMTKRRKFWIAIALFSIPCVAIYCLHVYFNPTWTEKYSYDNDTLIVMTEERKPYARGNLSPTGEVLVVKVTGRTGWSGGCGCSGNAPPAGERTYGSPEDQFAVNSFISASDGRVPFEPFVARGQGRIGPIAGHRKSGYLKIVFYKRGFYLGEEDGRVNEVQASQVRLVDLRDLNPLKNGVDEALKLLCPFDFATAEIQNTYWNHLLPNGLTIKDYALKEIEDISKGLTDEIEKARIKRAIARIRKEDFKGYPASIYQLTVPQPGQ